MDLFQIRYARSHRLHTTLGRPNSAYGTRRNRLGEPASGKPLAKRHPARFRREEPTKHVSLGEGTREERIARLFAVLFLAREPLSTRKLSQYANLADGTEARTLVTHLNRQFDERGRAFRAEVVAGGYQLVTRPKFAAWLRRLGHVQGELRLSAPAMETLAVVAYQQPVMRADIEAVRGVSCGEVLSHLLQQDLVRISGRSHELGRPYLYNTTKRFLQVFGLKSLDQLPRADLLRSPSHNVADGDPTSDKKSARESER